MSDDTKIESKIIDRLANDLGNWLSETHKYESDGRKIASTTVQSNMYGKVTDEDTTHTVKLPLKEKRSTVLKILRDKSQTGEHSTRARKVFLANMVESAFYPSADQLLSFEALANLNTDEIASLVSDVLTSTVVMNGHGTEHRTNYRLTEEVKVTDDDGKEKVVSKPDDVQKELVKTIESAVKSVRKIHALLYDIYQPIPVSADDDDDEDTTPESLFAMDEEEDNESGDNESGEKESEKQTPEQLAEKYKAAKKKNRPEKEPGGDVSTEKADSGDDEKESDDKKKSDK